MFPADDLGLEAHGSSTGHVGRDFGDAIPLRVPANPDYARLVWQGAGDGWELERGPVGPRVLVRNQPNRGKMSV